MGAGARRYTDDVLAFRAVGEELDVLRQAGSPFLVLGWGRQALGLVLDDGTDWAEVRELFTESFCVMAPQKLRVLVDRPSWPGEPGVHRDAEQAR